MKTAQISLEFLFSLGIIFAIFLFIFLFSLTQQGKYIRVSENLNIKDACLDLANRIIYTFLTGATTKRITAPYAFTIVNTSRVILINQTSCSLPLSAITSGTFGSGKIQLQNKNDFVEVTND